MDQGAAAAPKANLSQVAGKASRHPGQSLQSAPSHPSRYDQQGQPDVEMPAVSLSALQPQPGSPQRTRAARAPQQGGLDDLDPATAWSAGQQADMQLADRLHAQLFSIPRHLMTEDDLLELSQQVNGHTLTAACLYKQHHAHEGVVCGRKHRSSECCARE